ncbi:MAG TPA: TraX family protein [Polyangiaceae bacterium]
MTKVHTNRLTNYDLIKAAAVLIMVTDHVGAYFFPVHSYDAHLNSSDLWWRAVGRLGLPVWFFLVGHSRSRDLSPPIWIGATLLLVGNIVTGMSLLPLNALFSIIFIRLVLDVLARTLLVSRTRVSLGVVLLVTLEFPSNGLFEYGSLGLLMALMGFVWRHRAQVLPMLGNAYFIGLIAFIVATCVARQIVAFHFHGMQAAFVALGLVSSFVLLMRSPVREIPRFEAEVSRSFASTARWLGRRTLEIYVVHLLTFKLIAALVGQHNWFDWRWIG